ncbi:MAG: DUF6089 family protein [Bacteroidota bacterium]|nr:DUF6089 family protein [Bacteroidota bacterium]
MFNFKYIYIALAGLLICFPILGSSQIRQKATEISIFGGFSSYQGDLAQNVRLGDSRPAFGFALKRATLPHFAYTLGLNYGSIYASDADSKDTKARNLSFRSDILEFGLTTEFNFFAYQVGLDRKKFTPYLMTGIYYYKFKPEAELNGKIYSLSEYGTEGQGIIAGTNRYNLGGIAIPVGGGVKYALTKHINLLVHSAVRVTFTDYLDDVSGNYPDLELLGKLRGDIAVDLSDRSADLKLGKTGFKRGNSEKRDFYFFSGITLSYVINQPICPNFKRDPFGIL